MTSWDKFCIPQIALRWYKIHLPSSSSQWQSPWDAWSHRDNQEAACQNRIWTSNSGVSSKSKIYQLTGRKIDTPLLDQQGPQTHHKCPSCHHPHPHNSPKSENKIAHKNIHPLAHHHKQLNSKPKETLKKGKRKHVLLKLVKDQFQSPLIRQRNSRLKNHWSS